MESHRKNRRSSYERRRADAMFCALARNELTLDLSILDCTNVQLGKALSRVRDSLFESVDPEEDAETSWFNTRKAHDIRTGHTSEFSIRLKALREENSDGSGSLYAESKIRRLPLGRESIQSRFGYQWPDADDSLAVVTAFDMADAPEHMVVQPDDKLYAEAAAIIVRVHTTFTGIDPRFLYL